MEKEGKIILVDCDVLSHFIVGGGILDLIQIYDHPLKVLDKVYDELSRFQSRSTVIDNLFRFFPDLIMPFPEDNYEAKKEYFRLRRSMGDGESACLAVARYTKNIVASSNLRDIVSYCEEYEIEYLTTMDFLSSALKKGVMTEEECDNFIGRVLAYGSRLPVTKISDYKSLK